MTKSCLRRIWLLFYTLVMTINFELLHSIVLTRRGPQAQSEVRWNWDDINVCHDNRPILAAITREHSLCLIIASELMGVASQTTIYSPEDHSVLETMLSFIRSWRRWLKPMEKLECFSTLSIYCECSYTNLWGTHTSWLIFCRCRYIIRLSP